MYTPRQSIAVSTKSCPYDGIPFLSALRPFKCPDQRWSTRLPELPVFMQQRLADLPLDRNHPPCTRDTEGYPVLKRIERIENGEYIVLGDHPRSLDSRIFGPLSRSSILAVAMPVWVF